MKIKTKQSDKRRKKRIQTREDKNKNDRTREEKQVKKKLLTRGRDPDARSFMVKVKLNFLC